MIAAARRREAAGGVAVYGAIVAVTTALFLVFPGVDLATSRLFYEPQRGFFLSGWPPVPLLVATIPWIAGLIFAIAGIGAAWLFLLGRPLWRLDRKALVFVVASTVLGPGLLANTVLKDHWGRARPVQIEAFGGAHRFTPAPLPSSECRRNCSFVSGHAALGFALVAFALLLPRGRSRVVGQVATLGFGALVGLARIAEGAHFLSDVADAGLLVYGTSWLLYAWIVDGDGLATPTARRLYRAIGGGAVAADAFRQRLATTPAGRIALWIAAITIIEAISMIFIDRPLALFLHAQGADPQALFQPITRLGIAYPYLVLCGLAYLGLRWGGGLPRLQARAAAMRAAAPIPAFLFAAIAASGLLADLVKIVCGRTRPKLLFADGIDRFTWFALRPDHWSFPSGHATTIVALMAALWCLWPRHLLFYILVAAIVAASRVIIGAHYLSDVIFGAFIAVATTLTIDRIFARGGLDFSVLRRRRRTV